MVTAANTAHGEAAASIGPADRVVDLGCGTGQTTPVRGSVLLTTASIPTDL